MTLSVEKATNPFLRAPLLKAAIGMADAPDWEAFGEVRKRKDNFKG
jgi:hydroxyacylglutathione hydrolase